MIHLKYKKFIKFNLITQVSMLTYRPYLSTIPKIFSLFVFILHKKKFLALEVS